MQFKGYKKYIIYVVTSTFVLLFACYVGYFFGFILYKLDHANDVYFLDNYDFYELPSQIYDQYGKKLGDFYLFNRDLVDYKDIPQQFIYILLLIEDSRFYEHYGIDVYGMLRAFIKNLGSWKIVQGGSTIHQQLSKLVFTNREKTFRRKILDMWFAIQLERRYSKNEILEKYLNYIYFGHGVYGIKMASKFYFNKLLNELTIAEMVFLVALIQAPNRYSPLINVEETKKRHNLLFSILVKNSFISNQDALREKSYFWNHFDKVLLNTKNNKDFFNHQKNFYAAYFLEYIRMKLESNFLREYLEKYIRNKLKDENLDLKESDLEEELEDQLRYYLFTGGFKIYTSLDLDKQILAESIFLNTLSEQSNYFFAQNRDLYKQVQESEMQLVDFLGVSFLSSRFKFEQLQEQKKLFKILQKEWEYLKILKKSFHVPSLDFFFQDQDDLYKSQNQNDFDLIQGAWLLLNVKNAYLEVMLGGKNFYQNQFNRSFALRQPGSAFKMILYAIAFESGYQPNSLFTDEKIVFYNSQTGKIWNPANASQNHYGEMTLEDAFKYSINTIAVQLAKKIGLKKIAFFLKEIFDLSEDRLKNLDLSVALGTLELTPMEMLKGISILINDGIKINPLSILRIETKNSKILYDHNQNKQSFLREKRIFSKKTCEYMKNLMRKVITEGTGSYAFDSNPIQGFLYGKTGTSQDNKDLWFVGGDMENISSIWFGFDRGSVSLGEKSFSGNILVPMWLKFMAQLKQLKK